MNHEVQSYCQDETRHAATALAHARELLNQPEPPQAETLKALYASRRNLTEAIDTLSGTTDGNAPSADDPKSQTTRTARRDR